MRHPSAPSAVLVPAQAPPRWLDRRTALLIAFAFSVMADPRFAKVGVTWNFWAISDKLAPYAEQLVKDESGLILEKPNVNIYAKTWGQVLDENRARLKFFQDHLDVQVDRDASLKYLQQRYAAYLEGVFEVDDSDAKSEADAEPEADAASV